MSEVETATALWWAVVVSGIYHGLNPGMGWPLAVSSALMEQKQGNLYHALIALAVGHFIAMLAILLPFTMLITLVQWQREIQLFAAGLIICLGIYLLINRRHPRFLARVPPSRLGLWSFLAAMAHGAGLMLVPIYLGICGTLDTNVGHAAADELISGNLGIALLVAIVHTASMMLSGGVLAIGVYHWLGLKFLSRTWFNLDVVWALSLIVVGILAIVLTH
ncbi:hypothetical protein [Cognatiyoonia sp.]|uniref:hypothetical protein n=1 Tax=Cognatiyoonia sp. TaxID=2211652 RepID=UPI003F699093